MPLRRIEVARNASEALIALAILKPTAEEVESIVSCLRELAANPAAGYRVPFSIPNAYWKDVGRFIVVYTYDESRIAVSRFGVR